ncbi:MAG: TIGR03621 family F420-dependent LLM class oxidoreductase [Candidatus Xenobia bacterium]
MKKFRFGIQAGRSTDRKTWVELARQAEALGYSTLTIPDHFGDQLSPVPALTMAAAVTERLRIGALVWCNDYRHPVMLAKEVATLDVLSEGRVELGIGAGWMRREYEETGLPYDPAGVRIDRMVEGLAVMRGLFADGKFSYQGKYYTIRNLDGLPKPVQKPGPPVLIGGGGPKMLRTAAQCADIVGINIDLRSGVIDGGAAANATADKTAEKVQWVREVAGDRVELNIMLWSAHVTSDRQKALELATQQMGAPVADIAATPHFVIGSVDEICDTLRERRERYGLSYMIVQADAMRDFAPVVSRLSGT